jgi:hypothetical protein
MFRSGTRAEAKAKQGAVAPEVYPNEPGEESLGDHGLHVEDQTCARCGREIRPTDEARRTAKGDCVHMSC